VPPSCPSPADATPARSKRARCSGPGGGAIHGPVRGRKGKPRCPSWCRRGGGLGVVAPSTASAMPARWRSTWRTRLAAAHRAVASGEQVIPAASCVSRCACRARRSSGGERALRASARRGSLEGTRPTRRWPLVRTLNRAPRSVGRDRIALDVEGDPTRAASTRGRRSTRAAAQIAPRPARAPRACRRRAGGAGAVRDALGKRWLRSRSRPLSPRCPRAFPGKAATASSRARSPGICQRTGRASRSSGDRPAACGAIEVRPAEAFSAELSAESASARPASARSCETGSGTRLGASGFALDADGASVGPVQPSASGIAEASLEGGPARRAAQAWVTAGGRVLARTAICIRPAAGDLAPLRLGAGRRDVERGALEHPIRRRPGMPATVRSVESGLLAGLDPSYRDEIAASWEELSSPCPGISLDFSSAHRSIHHGASLPHGSLPARCRLRRAPRSRRPGSARARCRPTDESLGAARAGSRQAWGSGAPWCEGPGAPERTEGVPGHGLLSSSHDAGDSSR